MTLIYKKLDKLLYRKEEDANNIDPYCVYYYDDTIQDIVLEHADNMMMSTIFSGLKKLDGLTSKEIQDLAPQFHQGYMDNIYDGARSTAHDVTVNNTPSFSEKFKTSFGANNKLYVYQKYVAPVVWDNKKNVKFLISEHRERSVYNCPPTFVFENVQKFEQNKVKIVDIIMNTYNLHLFFKKKPSFYELKYFIYLYPRICGYKYVAFICETTADNISKRISCLSDKLKNNETLDGIYKYITNLSSFGC